jgi:hypothetical protein
MIKENIRGIIATILAIFFIYVAYQATVVVPRERMAFEKQKIEDVRIAENIEKFQKEIKYDECVQTAYEEYIMDFNQACKLAGKEKGCALPAYRADEISDDKDKKDETCVRLYGK